MHLKMIFLAFALCLVFYGTGQETRAQQREFTNELHKNRSAVERFEHTLLDTEDEKEYKRTTIQRQRKRLLAYLDTVSISRSLRKNLLRDLDKNPFSNRLKKFLVRYKQEVTPLVSTQIIAQKE